MALQALHHVTMITGDAPATVAFYRDLLGLRLIKKTVNFDQPQAYHLYFGDQHGAPGSVLTWFEFAGAPRGSAGAGMIYRLQLGVGGEAALAFWKDRLGVAGHAVEEVPGGLRLGDHDGLELELQSDTHGNPPLTATHPEVPPEHALTGVQGARAYAADPASARELLVDVLGFDHKRGDEYVLGGGEHHVHWGYDACSERGREGAGTVHHIAWHSPDSEHAGWRDRVRGPACTPPTSSTATTSSRSTSARRRASCSRSPRARRASLSTRTPATSASSCDCPPSTSTCAPGSSAR